MLKKNTLLKMAICGLPVICAVALLASPKMTRAAVLAADNASNYTSSTWTGNSSNVTTNPTANGGTGFGGWTVNSSPNGRAVGTFLATPTGNPASSNIATNGKSWGLYANNSSAAEEDLYRPFTSASGASIGTLRPGQAFSIAMAAHSSGLTGYAGFDLQSGNGTGSGARNVFTLLISGGNAHLHYTSNGASSATTVTRSDVNSGIVATFYLATPTTYDLTIAPATGNSFTPASYTNQTISGSINQVHLFDTNTTGNTYFNSMAITPEPASILPAGAGIAGVLGMVLLRRRRGAKLGRLA